MSRESLEPPRAPHFAPINCVCQTVKVQGPVSGNKKRGQKGLLCLSSEITSNTPSPLLEASQQLASGYRCTQRWGL